MHHLLYLVVLLAVCSLASARGTIYLNEIAPIRDAVSGVEQIPIECTLWEDSNIWLDNVYGIPVAGTQRGTGVWIDGVYYTNDNHHEGTWVFPNDLNVGNDVTVGGLLQPDGGFFVDDGDAGDANGDGWNYSFSVEDNNGNVNISGTLNVFGALSNNDDVTNPLTTFYVTDNTGETFINGLVSPNGGINIAQGVVTVAKDGNAFGTGDLRVEQDLYFGDEAGVSAYLGSYSNLFPPPPDRGGDLILQGQDATQIGGNLVFSPGFASGASDEGLTGRIFIGARRRNFDLYVARQDTAGGIGGKLIIGGQRSSAHGGDVYLQAGDSRENLGFGGDLVLAPGVSPNGYGKLFLGNPSDGPNIPIVVTRPDVVDSANAGITEIHGQDTFDADCGDLAVTAGYGSKIGGQLHLQPGSNGPLEGHIIEGNVDQALPENIVNVRVTDTIAGDAGHTWIIGQDSTGGNGGDLYFLAGNGTDTESGSIFISHGQRYGGAASGAIWWGHDEYGADLFIKRPAARDGDDGYDTIFTGQNSDNGLGGDLSFIAGSGATSGGSLLFTAGDGIKEYGGNIFFTDSLTVGVNDIGAGSNYVFRSGDGFTGGNIYFFAGDSGYSDVIRRDHQSIGGNIILAPGVRPDERSLAGGVTFRNANAFILESVPLIYAQQIGVDTTAPYGVVISEFPNTEQLNIVTDQWAFDVGSNQKFNFFTLTDSGYSMLQDRIIGSNGLPRFEYDPYNDLPYWVALEFAAKLAEVEDALIAHGLITVNVLPTFPLADDYQYFPYQQNFQYTDTALTSLYDLRLRIASEMSDYGLPNPFDDGDIVEAS